MNRIQAFAFALPMLLGACSAPSGSAPSDTSTTTAPATIASADVASDAGADAAADAESDASSDAGADAGDTPPKPRNPVAEAYRAKCCAPRAEKHAGLEAACQSGKVESCIPAAEDLRKGCGAPLDPDKAAALEDKACALGSEPACTARSMSDLGDSWNNDGTLASLCAKSPLTGCFELAEHTYYFGDASAANRLLGLYKRACDAGEGRACIRLGDRRKQIAEVAESPAPRREEILDYYVRGCKANTLYCYQQTATRLHGEWTKRDNSDILPRLAPILLAGHEELCESECDCDHPDVARWAAKYEPARARAYAEKVCEAQGPEACTAFGEMLEKGVGGPVDLPRAIGIYKAACPHDKDACDDLAALYEEGRGVDKDPEAARKLAEQACPLSKSFEYPTGNVLPQSKVHGPLAGCTRAARYREEGFGGEVNLKGAYQVYYYYCGTTEGVGLCGKRIALGRRLGFP